MLDTSCGDLVLRISSASRTGQVVRVRSPKCTIGSGPRCTLRLRARGVAPIHCLVLRGPAGTVARCWSGDTRLNDRSFTDAPLASGDRLSVGPIELEVLETGVMPDSRNPARQQPQPRARADERREGLLTRLTAIDAERHASDAERKAFEAERNTLEADRKAFEAEQSRLEADRKAFDADRNNLEAERRTLDAEQSTWEAKRKAFDTNRNEVETARQALLEERRQWTVEQEAAVRELDEQRRQLAARLAEDDGSRQAMAAEQDHLQSDRNTLAEQHQRWQAEQEETLRQIDDQRKQLLEKSNELEAAWNDLNSQRADIENQRNALASQQREWQASQETAQQSVNQQSETLSAEKAQLDAERQALDSQRADIENQRNALAEQQRQWEAEREKALHEIDEQRERIAAEMAAVETERQSVAESRSERDASRRFEEEEAVEDHGKATAALEPEEIEFKEPTERAPVDLNEIFRRVGAKLDLLDDEPDEPEAEKPVRKIPLREPDTLSKAPQVRPAMPSSPATPMRPLPPPAISAVSASDVNEDEESIEDYMSRLMQRVRLTTGETESLPRAAQHAETNRAARDASSGAFAADLSTSSRDAEQAAAREPEPVRQRAPAPSKPINLEALREVANLSAKNALGQHARRALVRSMYSKLVLATVALGSAGGLFWLWKQYGASELTLYSSVAAVIVAVLAVMQYSYLTGRLIIGKHGRIDIDWHGEARTGSKPDAAEDVAADTAAVKEE